MIQKKIQEEIRIYYAASDKHKPALSKHAKRYMEMLHVAFNCYKDFPEQEHCINAMGDLFVVKYQKKFTRQYRRFILKEALYFYQENPILEKSIVKSYLQQTCLQGLKEARELANPALRLKSIEQFLRLAKDLFEINKEDEFNVNKEDLGNKVFLSVISLDGTNKAIDWDNNNLSDVEKDKVLRTIYLPETPESISKYLNNATGT